MSALPYFANISSQRALRILCVDDLADIRYVLHLLLQNQGHQVTCAEDGDEALAILRDDPDAFDLIITDHQMPVMNGLEMVSSLRSVAYRGKILVFSSSLDLQVIQAYRALGVDDILDKPLPPPELFQAINRACLGSEAATKGSAVPWSQAAAAEEILA